MEVDATSDDSDATVADEEDLPSTAEVTRFRFPPADRVGSSSHLSAPSAQAAYSEAAAQLPQSSRASDGEDTGPVSPSLLSGYDASKGYERHR